MNAIERLALISVHTGPLATPGDQKVGGMNVYVRELSQELGARGIAVDIYTRRSSPADPQVDTSLGENIRVIYLPAGPEQPLAPDEVYPHLSEFTAKLIAYATRHNLHYDMVYSHYWLSGWVAAKLKEAWGTPFVHMYHTLGHMKMRIVTHDVYVPDVRINVETQVANWADRLVAATPAEHTQLLWLYRAKRRKIAIIPPGVNIDRFYPQATVKSELGFDEICRLLLFVGRIEPLKAVDTILKALAVIRDNAPELLDQLCFAVIGGDLNNPAHEELARLQVLADELELNDYVRFMGAMDQTLLPKYYAAATAVIMPSDYESFGMVALEAMASGTPVIASEVGGLAFLVKDNETGFHVPVREPGSLAGRIQALLSDMQRSQKMGQIASRHARDYAWPRIADQIIQLFDEVMVERLKRNSTRRRNSEYP